MGDPVTNRHVRRRLRERARGGEAHPREANGQVGILLPGAGSPKRTLKAFIIRWELYWYALSAFMYLAAVPTLIWVFPDVSNLWVSIFVLVSGLFATIAAAASAIKSNDTEE